MRINPEKFSPSYFHIMLMKTKARTLAFSENQDFSKWKQRLRKKFMKLIGPLYMDRGKPEYEVIDSEIQKGMIIKKIVFPTNRWVMNAGYLVIPSEKKEKYPAMVCLQGHSPGAHISIGKARNKYEMDLIRGDRDFAIQAAKNGYVALAIEQRCFGERQEKIQRIVSQERCQDAFLHALMLGHTLVAERVSDVIRGIDLLVNLHFVDADRIGCMGNSAGGTTTYYSACIDKRIKVAVVSCSFCQYEESKMKVHHCCCGYIPGVLQYFGMEDLAGLIVPRHLLIVAGKKDRILPFGAVVKGFKTVKKIYEKAGFPENTKLVIGSDGHRFYGNLVWPEISRTFSSLESS